MPIRGPVCVPFDMRAPGGEKAVGLRARIKLGDTSLTETWTCRWPPQSPASITVIGWRFLTRHRMA